MQKYFLLISFFVASIVNAQTSTAPDFGDGTSQYPYQISSLNNLYWLSQNSAQWVAGKYFIQTADIDASSTSTWFSNGSGGYYGFPCIGGTQTIGNQLNATFIGNYDGQGFKISNLYINRPNDRIGLFGKVGAATIKNLVIENPTVVIPSTSAVYGSGILIGYSAGATVDNVHVVGGSITSNNVTGIGFACLGPIVGWEDGITVSNSTASASVTTNGGYSGGFVGIKASGTSSYTNCKTTGTVTSSAGYRVGGFVGQTDNSGTVNFNSCSSSGNVSALGLVGGFVGYIASLNSNYTNCYALGNVSTSGPQSGGFYGNCNGNTSVFTNCYSKGSVSGSSAGGFGYQSGGTNTYVNCFWDTQTSGKSFALYSSTPSGIIGKTTTEMKTLSTFTNASWDFYNETVNGTNDYWILDASQNSGYPSLVYNIRTWNGSVNTDWSNSSNWDQSIIPGANSIVKIKAGATNLPAFVSDITLDRLDFNGQDYILDLGSSNLTCNGVLGFASTRYIKTSGNGVVKISIPAAMYRYFPVGKTAFNPVGIANRNASSDIFSVRVSDELLSGGSSGSAVTSPSVNRTWDISKLNSNTGSGVDVFVTWNLSEEANGISTYKLYHHNGTSWVGATGTSSSPIGSTIKTLRHTGYTGTFSPFAIGSNSGTLPVSWLSFTGKSIHGAVQLNWSTASERNNSHFEIQRSADAVTFVTVGRVGASASPNIKNDYSFIDAQPLTGTSFYRLKQVDLDGKSSYSSTIQINGVMPTGFKEWYNSSAGKLVILTPQALIGTFELNVFDPSGKLVARRVIMAGLTELDFPKVGSGVYYCNIISKGEVLHTGKFMVLN